MSFIISEKDYCDFNIMNGKLAGSLSNLGKEISEGRGYSYKHPNKFVYNIEDSTVVLNTINLNGTFKAEIVIAGKSHKKIAKQVSDILKELEMKNISIRRYK